MIENKSDGSRHTWEDIGKGAAAQIKKTARKVSYIEARGYLCHELTYLLGGRVEFTATPMSKLITKAIEYFFPISPICRWMPPPKSTLEEVGYHGTGETTVYRYKPEAGDAVVFFVNFKPEPPVGGAYLRPIFNMPQLDLYQGALRLTHAGDFQAGDFLIHRCKHLEACDGGSDWGSI